MELRRFFVDKSSLDGDTVRIFGAEFLHLKNVLRLKVGFKIIVCLNDNIDRYATITEISRDHAATKIDKVVMRETKSKNITLFASLIKNNKLDLVIQKAVELGIDTISPFISQNTSETKFNLERAERIAFEAAKQCGSATLTKVSDIISFDDILVSVKNFDTVIMPYEKETDVSFSQIEIKGKSIAIIIGSEGGFTDSEAKAAKEAGAITVSLGKRILRADTASIVTSALVMEKAGELDL